MGYPRHLSYTTTNMVVFATKLTGTHTLVAFVQFKNWLEVNLGTGTRLVNLAIREMKRAAKEQERQERERIRRSKQLERERSRQEKEELRLQKQFEKDRKSVV